LNVYAKNHGNCRIVEFEGQKFAVVPDGLIGCVQFRFNSGSFGSTELLLSVDQAPLNSGFIEADVGNVVSCNGQYLATGWRRNGSLEGVVGFNFEDTIHFIVADVYNGEMGWKGEYRHRALVDMCALVSEPVLKSLTDIGCRVTPSKPRSIGEIVVAPLDECTFRRDGDPERLVLFFGTESVLKKLRILDGNPSGQKATSQSPVEPVEQKPVAKPKPQKPESTLPKKWIPPWENPNGGPPIIFGNPGATPTDQEWYDFTHPTK